MTAPTPPTVYGPYGQVPNGARYSTQGAQVSRDGIMVHTYESTGDTLSLARVLATLATPGTRPTASGGLYGVSYHAFPKFPEGPAGEYHEVLDERHAPNAGGQIPNRRLLHFCLWGRAGQTREQWLDATSYPQLQALARYIADKSQVHHFPIVHLECVGPNWGQTAQQKLNAARAKAPGKIGVLGHRDGTATWGGSHGDPGIHFPWDVVLDLARHYLQGDDMAQLVNTPGDPAAFEVSGTAARWIPDWDSLAWLWSHKLVATTVTTVPRADLKRLHLSGPAPADVAPGQTTIAGSEFATWNPAA